MSSGDKYRRTVRGVVRNSDAVTADVYCILDAFGVACPARAHAVKKLLCAGDRGKADVLTDLIEAKDAIDRAITLQWQRNNRMALYQKGSGSDRTQAPRVFRSSGSVDLGDIVIKGGAGGSASAVSDGITGVAAAAASMVRPVIPAIDSVDDF